MQGLALLDTCLFVASRLPTLYVAVVYLEQFDFSLLLKRYQILKLFEYD